MDENMVEVDEVEEVEFPLPQKTFMVYMRDRGNWMLKNAAFKSTNYRPNATELGDAWGTGEYLCIEVKEDDSSYARSYISGVITKVVAQTYFSEDYDD